MTLGRQGLDEQESGPSCIPQNPIKTPSVRGSDRQNGVCRRVASTVASLGVCPLCCPLGRPPPSQKEKAWGRSPPTSCQNALPNLPTTPPSSPTDW